jgi:hypothetical protein
MQKQQQQQQMTEQGLTAHHPTNNKLKHAIKKKMAPDTTILL